SLYVDWKSENPSSFYEGSPSLYTSVENNGSAPIRLVSDGTSGTGSVPLISGLAATASGSDKTPVLPFSNVSVTDADPTTTVSATVTLNVSGVASDANGTLSGTGLTRTATGTYTLAAVSPTTLTAELQALTFTPTIGEGPVGTSFTTKIGLSINDSDGSSSASTVLTETATCFLAGTLIATPAGNVAVETLRAGDVVSVLEAGRSVGREIVWAGHGRMDAARFGHRDEAFPIRIRAGAFADTVPVRDLLVTPEHCLLTEAGLVPARMLVNGASILIDRNLPAYDFFHVELDRHAILLAEGLATESYLDTGNRFLFADAGPDAARPAEAPPVSALAAPLAVARALVEPVWTRLAERAAQLGFERPAGAVRASTLTGDPELRLLLEDGVELSACSGDPLHHTFRIPAGVRPVRLLSRLAVPAQVIGPFVDDRRTLGVQVEKLVLWAGLTDIVLPASELTLAGWHENEGGLRWTNGMASLDLPATPEPTFIDVHLSGTALYPERQMA
ncbi:MAG: Hint domain-containing protein, partial [Janthinobacterium lividum]